MTSDDDLRKTYAKNWVDVLHKREIDKGVIYTEEQMEFILRREFLISEDEAKEYAKTVHYETWINGILKLCRTGK